MKISSPCMNCQYRAIPKTCEKTCEKWQVYRKDLSRSHKLVKLMKYGGLYD